ncbi:hypothetical protein TSTA_110340 [Talaromyces stipitatus ATCC 10500]|uniref:Uncharacterized protein n=1 Tax=Talaromyces stipitatus (strain ATCC 10500 / CBS 375.48 / QM 6759 / NRRL 1006) TaxID=441959 RepID=B8MUT4_TALSN|nr:uncharacterized protein TSTA_110340 [Talaromyces stipitatus ATCC 10500]EED11854.1 hypothetical protein TSTA_110340 [Talaromyces stipitatus ATCC 10500]
MANEGYIYFPNSASPGGPGVPPDSQNPENPENPGSARDFVRNFGLAGFPNSASPGGPGVPRDSQNSQNSGNTATGNTQNLFEHDSTFPIDEFDFRYLIDGNPSSFSGILNQESSQPPKENDHDLNAAEKAIAEKGLQFFITLMRASYESVLPEKDADDIKRQVKRGSDIDQKVISSIYNIIASGTSVCTPDIIEKLTQDEKLQLAGMFLQDIEVAAWIRMYNRGKFSSLYKDMVKTGLLVDLILPGKKDVGRKG